MSNLKLIERRGAICSDCFCQRDSALMACANTLPAKKDFVRNKVMSLAIVPSLRYQGALGGGGWQEWWLLFALNQQGHGVGDSSRMNSSVIALLTLECHL